MMRKVLYTISITYKSPKHRKNNHTNNSIRQPVC